MSIAYRRLDPSKREIRLLEIQSARNISDPIECRLVTVSLNDNVDFIALSSRLGDATDLDKLWVAAAGEWALEVCSTSGLVTIRLDAAVLL